MLGFLGKITMEISREQFDKIEAYLEGRLSGDEHAAFERRLQSDSKLRDLVQEQNELVSGIRKAARLEWQQKMDEWHAQLPSNEIDPSAPKVRPMWPKWVLLAASLAAIFILFWWKSNLGPRPTPPRQPEKEERPVATGRPMLSTKIPVEGTPDTVRLVVVKPGADREGYDFDNKILTLKWDKSAADLNDLHFFLEKK